MATTFSYAPLPDHPQPAGSGQRRLPVKVLSSILFSVLLVSSFVALVIFNPQQEQVVPLAATTTNNGRSPLSRGVSQGVSEKSSRLFSNGDADEIYPWTNVMLSWQRTSYHFQPEKNWMNDPNGPLFHLGWYHLFYQYNPDSAVWGNITWGHAVSKDMINWFHLPFAFVPDQWYDINGVWSGSATLLPDGRIVMLYTGDTSDFVQVQCLASPANVSDPLLIDWVKYSGNPVLTPPPGIGIKDFRDPTTAWVGADGIWRITIGSKVNKTGISLVYKTTNFTNYELLDEWLHEVPGTGMWECIDFYPISTTEENGLDTSANGPDIKHVLKASLDDDKHDYYAFGTYDPLKDKWTPDNPELDVGIGLRLDYGKYYASKTFYDHHKQRRVLWGWTGETDSEATDLLKGWASVQTVPRTVVFDMKTKSNILQWPIEEVEKLRIKKEKFKHIKLGPGSVVPLKLVGQATQLDISAKFEIEKEEALESIVEADVGYNCTTSGGSAGRGVLGPFGLIVLADESRSEQTPVEERSLNKENMKNSVSDHDFYIESEDEDDEKHDEEEGNDSDSSNYSDDNPPQRKPSSLNPSWPQSYRQSIDLYSSVPSPSLNFLGTPNLSRLGSSFLSSSLTRRHTPEILPTLNRPLLQTVQDEQPSKERRSSHSLLPPRRPSLKKIPPDQKSTKDAHGVSMSRQSSYGQAVLNGMNVLCGVGILSTPYAVREGGYFGLLILLLYAVLSFYTGVLLRYCLDSQPGLETYPDIGQAAFGSLGRIAISIILYVELYACCVEYIILESDNLSSLFPNAHLNIGGLVLNSHYLFAIMTTLAVLPTVWLRNLSVLSYISAGGVVASVLVVLCLFWLGLVDQVGFEAKGSTTLNLSTLPVAIGLYGYCYSGHAVFPNIYTSMEKPKQFPMVLLTSFGICTVLYAGVAVLGYLMFGESTQSQFTLNMPQEFMASKIAVWTTVVNPFSKYALTMSPVAMSMEELIPSNYQDSRIYAILIRTALVISTLVVALSIPFFGLVMALIGSLLTMLVTLILPCVCFLSILRGKVTLFQQSLCILIIAVGTVSSAFGTYSAVSKIIQALLGS